MRPVSLLMPLIYADGFTVLMSDVRESFMVDQRDCAVDGQYAALAPDAAAAMLCHDVICVHVGLSECIPASK